MTPTRGNEEIEGRSYKDYAYSPVSVSSPSAVCDTPPVRESVELNVRGRTSLRTTGEEMTEKGSKLPQFLAAGAGKSASVNICRAKSSSENKLIYFCKIIQLRQL